MDQTTRPNRSALARIAVRSTVWVTIGNYLNQLVGFAATLVLTRLLSAEIFGFLSLATFWFSTLNLRPKAGLNYAAIQHPQTDGDLLGTYFALDTLASIGSLALSAAAAILLTRAGYAPEVALLLIALTVADAINSLPGALSIALEKEMQLSRLTLMSLVISIAAYSVAVLLARAGAGVWSLAAINLLSGSLAIGGVYWVCRRRYPAALHFRWRFDAALARRLLRRGVTVGLSLTALGAIVLQFDNFLIGTFVGYATLGFYDRAYRIASWTNLLLTTVVTRVGFLTFSKVRDDLPRLTHAVRLALWALTTLGTPIAIVLFFSAADLVGVLYGAKWSESAFFLRFLTVYSFVWPFVSLAIWLSVALGKSRVVTTLTLAQIITLVTLATPMTLWWGVNGTILGVGITMALAFGLSCVVIFRAVPLSIGATFGAPLIAAGIAAGVLWLLTAWSVWSGLPPLVRLCVTGAAGFGAFLLALFGLKPAEMRERMRYLRLTWRKV